MTANIKYRKDRYPTINNLSMIKTAQNDNLSYVIKQLPSLTVFIDRQFKIIFYSQQWESTFNFNKNKILNKDVFTLFENVDPKWKENLKLCFDGESILLGKHVTTLNAKQHFFEWRSKPWYNEDESIQGAILQLEDVTTLILKEKAFSKVENLLKKQDERLKIGRWEYDIINNRLLWCDVTRAIHEVSPDYIPNVENALFFYKEGNSRNSISMALFEATDKGTSWNLKLQIVTPTGKEKWVMVAGDPIYNNKKIIGLSGTFQDINEEVLVKNKTTNNEKLLRTLIDNLPINVYVKDTESRKILVNKAEYEYLGHNSDENIIGKTDYDLYPSDSAKTSMEEDKFVMATLKPIIGKETENTTIEGKKTSFLSSKIPFLDQDGEVRGIIGLSLDISNLKEKENELREIINIASLQNKKLLDFAHIVSHNLRSHSANFSMLLDFLHSEKDESEKNRILKMLTEASNNLLETLDNLNDVVTISSKTNLNKDNIILKDKIADVKHGLFGFLLNNRAKIINEVPDDFKVKSVSSYLENILINLITNAVKYKHKDRFPKINFSASSTDNYQILIIRDNGQGIDLEKYGSKLFGMYKTFHEHENSNGVGLYISKNQIEAMKGKIEVTSEVGKGTEFKIYFNERD